MLAKTSGPAASLFADASYGSVNLNNNLSSTPHNALL